MKQRKPHLLARVSIVLLAVVLFFGGNAALLGIDIAEAKTAATSAESYYANLNTSTNGKTFRSNLKQLITETQYDQPTYKQLTTVFKTTDADPDHPGNVLLYYTGTSVSSGYNYNREHVWPKDAGKAFPAESQAGSDAHHLRPTDSQLNSTRGSLSFDEVTGGKVVKQNGSTTYGNLCYTGGGFFYPGEGYRGSTARILMYVQTRWGNEFNLTFVDSAGKCKTIGKISTLMKWHLEEPPTEAEKLRNEAVYKIQGNRNPFIDHPEFAMMIYCNDGGQYNKALQEVASKYNTYDKEDITSIALSADSKDLSVGQTVEIRATLTPTNAVREMLWYSTDTSVATVENGKVTAVGVGTTTITAVSKKDTSISGSLTLTVRAISDIRLSGTLIKTVYYAGDRIDPSGITVNVTYTDGTTGTMPASACEWLDAVTGAATLSEGTTAVICRLGDKSARLDGITVKGAISDHPTTPEEILIAAYRLAVGASLSGTYSLTGKIKSVTYDSQYNDVKMTIVVDGFDQYPMYCYACKGDNPQGLKAGDYVTVTGTIKNYNGTIEFDKNCTFVRTGGTSECTHVWNSGTVTRAATCVAAGVRTLSCTKCGATKTESIAPTGIHTAGSTWKTDGTKHWHTCTVCGTEMDSAAHTPGSSWETDSAKHWHVCAVCGILVDEATHTWGIWVVDLEPTETVAGTRHRDCTVCGASQTGTIAPLNHTHTLDTKVERVEPTCTTAGSETVIRYCTECEEELSRATEPLAPLGHQWGAWLVTREATDDEDGEETRVCDRCNEKETRVIPHADRTEAFRTLVSAIAAAGNDRDARYAAIRAARALYAELNETERAAVADEYAALVAAQNAWNEAAEAINTVQVAAIDAAFRVFFYTASALAVVLFLFKRKIL